MSTIINATTTNGVVIQPDNSGSLQLATNSGTTAVTISTAQNVGIGTASPTGKLQVSGAGGVSGSTNLVYVDVTSSYGGISVNSTANNNNFVELLEAGTKVGGFNADTTNNVTSLQSDGGHALAFNTGGTTERMRIDSNGKVMFNTSSVLNAGYMSLLFDGSAINGFTIKNSSATFGPYLYFVNSAGNVAGYVIQNGTTTVSYTTSSDYRLKENIVPMTGALDKVLQLKPVNYTWKQDGLDGQGFIAHELQAIVPDAVVGEKDAVDAEGNPKYQGVDTSFLVATLTAAIQEQQTIINDLKARIETLEAK